eukprot:5212546-Alexandrium_andersonii.AAC.1
MLRKAGRSARGQRTEADPPLGRERAPQAASARGRLQCPQASSRHTMRLAHGMPPVNATSTRRAR